MLVSALVMLLASGFFITLRQTMHSQSQAQQLQHLLDKQVRLMANDISQAGAQIQWSAAAAQRWPIDIDEEGKQITLFFQVTDGTNAWQQFIRYQQQGKQLRLCEWRQAIGEPHSEEPLAPCYQVWDPGIIQLGELKVSLIASTQLDVTRLVLRLSLTASFVKRPQASYRSERTVLVNNSLLGLAQGG